VIKRPGMETFTFPGARWTDWADESTSTRRIDIPASHPGGINREEER